jgi:protein SCO1/2
MTTATAFRSVALLLALLACDQKPQTFNPSGLAGPSLGQAIPKPDFTLTATDGSQFNFRQQTEGKIALLFFGYTHCPDVCPVHLANIAAALHSPRSRGPAEGGSRIRHHRSRPRYARGHPRLAR